MRLGILLLFLLNLAACKTNSQKVNQAEKSKTEINDPTSSIEKVIKTEEEWSQLLSESEYYVIRKKGTERPFTGPYWDNKKEGIYKCRACDLELFDAATKFKSGTGWPSYYQPLREEVILEDTDYDLGYARTEVMCNRCEGHLGHVFPDGPKPTGLRYCINGTSLKFVEKEK